MKCFTALTRCYTLRLSFEAGLRVPHAPHRPPIWFFSEKRKFVSSAPAFQKTADSAANAQQDVSSSRSTRSKNRGKTSLRRVAVEAERSSGGFKAKSPKRSSGDHEHDTKIVTAYCAAEQYRIPEAAAILKGVGYTLDPSQTGLYPQVLHIQSFNTASSSYLYTDKDGNPNALGDIFVFPSGTVVAWDVDDETVTNLISTGLLPAAENATPQNAVETEDLQYIEDLNSHRSKLLGDTISIGTKPDPEIAQETQLDGAEEADQNTTNTTLAKIAFSSGLARSAKLAVLENALEAYFQSTKSIPDLMSAGSKIPFTRRFIIRKTGELLKLRAQLNLNSELTDSLPDMFWDSRYELGLEGHFDNVSRALDVNVRSRVLNQRMDYAAEIVSVLREQLSERHGLTLEWLIIGLIAIEVAFEIFRLVGEHRWEFAVGSAVGKRKGEEGREGDGVV